MNITETKRVVNQVIKQLPKGLKTACGDLLEKKVREQLTKKGIYPQSKQENDMLRLAIEDEQVKLVRGYIKKNHKKCPKDSHYDRTAEEAALKTACHLNKPKVLRTLLKNGISPKMPTEDGHADRLLTSINKPLAKIILEFYNKEDLKKLIAKDKEKGKTKTQLSPHNPHKHFPEAWIVALAKTELIKKVLEDKHKDQTITIEV
jgi:hypothetical protein